MTASERIRAAREREEAEAREALCQEIDDQTRAVNDLYAPMEKPDLDDYSGFAR